MNVKQVLQDKDHLIGHTIEVEGLLVRASKPYYGIYMIDYESMLEQPEQAIYLASMFSVTASDPNFRPSADPNPIAMYPEPQYTDLTLIRVIIYHFGEWERDSVDRMMGFTRVFIKGKLVAPTEIEVPEKLTEHLNPLAFPVALINIEKIYTFTERAKYFVERNELILAQFDVDKTIVTVDEILSDLNHFMDKRVHVKGLVLSRGVHNYIAPSMEYFDQNHRCLQLTGNYEERAILLRDAVGIDLKFDFAVEAHVTATVVTTTHDDFPAGLTNFEKVSMQLGAVVTHINFDKIIKARNSGEKISLPHFKYIKQWDYLDNG